jgi:sugar lactone lactonase YvrE
MEMTRRQFLTLAAAGAAVAAFTACGGGGSVVSSGEDWVTWGEFGTRNGFFRQPRGIVFRNGELYVIDRTGRIQVFTAGGEFLRCWSTPEQKVGTPPTLAFDAEGNVLVPDTHYSRILEYTPQGELIRKWGTYGTDADHFIYPTGIARGKDGAYFISEYGMDAERVHVFDSERRFLRQWGSQGDGPGQFNRMMAIRMDANETLYGCDTTNNRIQCFDTEGKFLRQIGSVGEAPGHLKFPYGIGFAPDGSLFVAEYGNHRISRFAADGRFIGAYGSPGRNPGEFNGPRGVVISPDGFIFISDTDNHRIQRIRIGGLPPA